MHLSGAAVAAVARPACMPWTSRVPGGEYFTVQMGGGEASASAYVSLLSLSCCPVAQSLQVHSLSCRASAF